MAIHFTDEEFEGFMRYIICTRSPSQYNWSGVWTEICLMLYYKLDSNSLASEPVLLMTSLHSPMYWTVFNIFVVSSKPQSLEYWHLSLLKIKHELAEIGNTSFLSTHQVLGEIRKSDTRRMTAQGSSCKYHSFVHKHWVSRCCAGAVGMTGNTVKSKVQAHRDLPIQQADNGQ